MAVTLIDLTTPQPGGKFGDPTKTAWEKANDNFIQLESGLGAVEAGAADGEQALTDVTELSSAISSALGSAIVGYKRVETDTVQRTTYDKLQEWVSVLDFAGVDNSGSADSTAGIQKAISVPGRCVLFPPGTYLCGALKPANGVHLLGFSGNGYTADETHNRPRLAKLGSASCVLDMTGTRSVSASGLLLDGITGTTPVISSGASRFGALNCRIINGSVGLGGSIPGGGTAYTMTAHLTRCTFASCGTGVQNMIDSFFTECEFANNGNNIYGIDGADSNGFANCRIEWATTGNNIRLVGSAGKKVSSYTFSSCILDRGFGASIFLSHCSDMTFTGGIVRRANRSEATTETGDTNVYMTNCNSITFAGVTHTSGRDDEPDPEDAVTPGYAYTFGPGNRDISIVGGSIVSPFPKGSLRNPDSVAGLKVLGVGGIDERITGGSTGPQINNGGVYRSAATGGDVASGASSTRSLLTRRTVNTNSMTAMTLNVTARNTANGSGNSASFLVQLTRLSGTPTIAASKLGEVGGANFINIGGGTVSLALNNVSADGSSFDVVVTNSGGSSVSVVCILV